jgi:hypothetical protein
MAFDKIVCYEDRDAIKTSRWLLDGIKTKTGSLNVDGSCGAWLYMTASYAAPTLTVTLYKDAAGTNSVATGTSNLSTLSTAPVKVTLAQANTSGISGSFYVHRRASDVTLVPVLVGLCVDADLEAEYDRLSTLPNYDATAGMAEYIAYASRTVLMRVASQFKSQLGGYGDEESPKLAAATRDYPDFRAIASPEQLREAAVHCAMEQIFYSRHELADETMYSARAQRHAQKFEQAMAGLNLAFNTDPDSDQNADQTASYGAVRLVRV